MRFCLSICFQDPWLIPLLSFLYSWLCSMLEAALSMILCQKLAVPSNAISSSFIWWQPITSTTTACSPCSSSFVCFLLPSCGRYSVSWSISDNPNSLPPCFFSSVDSLSSSLQDGVSQYHDLYFLPCSYILSYMIEDFYFSQSCRNTPLSCLWHPISSLT